MGEFFTGEVDQPTAQSYGSVYQDAIKALVNSMGSMYSSDSQYSKLFNALSRNDQSASLSAYNSDLQKLNLQNIEYQKQYANSALNYEKQYGNQYLSQQLANLKASDPEYWQNYETQGAQVLADLQKGNAMSDSQVRASQQAIRAGQAARGNAYGNASAAQEVYNQFIAGEQLAQQRQAAATSFLKSSPYNRFNIGSLTAYQPGTYTQGYSTLTPYAMSNATNVASGNAAYQSNIYGKTNAWQMQESNQPAPFFSMMSGGIGGAQSGAMAGFMTGGPIGAIVGGVLGGVSGGVMGAFSK